MVYIYYLSKTLSNSKTSHMNQHKCAYASVFQAVDSPAQNITAYPPYPTFPTLHHIEIAYSPFPLQPQGLYGREVKAALR